MTGAMDAARNVEIKAKLSAGERARVRDVAIALGAREARWLTQKDTFFGVSQGRLKLRQFDATSGELIAYSRPDSAGPSLSSYVIYPTSDPTQLLAALSASLPCAGVVEKRRELLLLGCTRIHLDDVLGLGEFLELEVVLDESDDAARGEEIAHRLLERFGINASALIDRAYVDLIESP